jgi:hypothetical protein
MSPSDHKNSQTLQKISIFPQRRCGAGGLGTLILLALSLVLSGACRSPAPEATAADRLCLDDGMLVTELHGSLQGPLEWHGDSLECEGMPRPNGEGARLRFAGPAQEGSAKRSLAFILAMPDLRQGETGKELPTNVTMIDEISGRFFGTQDTDNCWTDIERHEQLAGSEQTNYRVSGIVYCLAPIAELNGNASVMVDEMSFTGRLNWEVPE